MKKENLRLFKNNIWAIIKKELRFYFDSPTAYIVMVVFLFLGEFMFFKQVFLIGEVSLRPLFSLVFWLFLLLIPAITMGTIAAEKNDGTIEFLLTKPLRQIELIFGKFISALIFVAITLLFFLPIAVVFSQFGDLDWGVVLAEYLASIFVAALLISLGLAVSSYFKSQILAFLVTAVISLFIIIIGFDLVISSLPYWLVQVVEKFSLLIHFNSISRGVIDLRNLWYIFSFLAIFLALAYLRLIKDKYGNQARVYRNYKISIGLFLGIVIFANVISSRLPGRIDLTQDKIFTLTEATEEVLKNLNDVVNITLYLSQELPPQIKPLSTEVKDILHDYQKIAQNKILLEIKDPRDNQIAEEMRSYGVEEVQFNVIGQEEFKIKKGVFGLVVSYGTKYETIPFIEKTGDLEYQVTSFIAKLTTKDKKKVVFIESGEEENFFLNHRLIKQELDKQFVVESFKFNPENPSLPAETNLIVFAGSRGEVDQKLLENVKNYWQEGGSLMFLVDGVLVNPQLFTVEKNPTNLISWLKEIYGVTLNNDLIYDLRSNETVSFGGGLFIYYLPYPFWPRALAQELSPVTRGIKSFILPWASSLDLEENKLREKGLEVIKLFGTSDFASSQIDNYDIGPEQNFSRDNLGLKNLAVALQFKEEKEKSGRVIIVADSDFILDNYLGNNPENSVFLLESLSWLVQEKSLATIKLKQTKDRKFLFSDSRQPIWIKYGNLIFVILAPAIFGFTRLFLRRRRKKLNYPNSL